MDKTINKSKEELISEIERRVEDKIIEKTNADLIIKLINNSDSLSEAIAIAQLGTTYKRTGFHFDKRLEKMDNTIKYFRKNEELSFVNDSSRLTHKLIIGDNYDALLNLLIEYRNKIDVIYIDPPYGKDDMGDFAIVNYNNNITRDNLLSMLYPRLYLAKQLLSENGVIYCSMDNKNNSYVKCLFDEIFGEANYLGTIIQRKGNAQNDALNIQNNHDYIITYCKNRKYEGSKEKPILRDGKIIKKEVSLDENGKYYYKGSGIVTGGQGGTLNKRKNLGYTIYYNKTTKDKIAIQDYNLSLAETSNDESLVYSTKNEYISKGYTIIRPPKKGSKLGAWTWSLEKFNREKDNIFITDNLSVVQKVYVDEKNIFNIDGKQYYIKDSLTKNINSVIDFNSGSGTTQLKEVMTEKDFDNPKNVELIKFLVEIYRGTDNPTVLDFFAGSGTTGQAVLSLNRDDDGLRKCILVTSNEITDKTPNGVPYDVTTKRLKRIMSGECYDGNTKFDWIKNNEPYGDNLDVFEIDKVANFESSENKTPFDVIDETLYGLNKFNSVKKKIEWVCNNFEHTQKDLESDEAWKERLESE